MVETVDLASLPAADTLSGSEIIPIVQSGLTKRTTASSLASQLATPASQEADRAADEADQAAIDATRAETALSSINAYLGTNFSDAYPSKADAIADIANITLNASVPVLIDETLSNLPALYKKTGPATLTLVSTIPAAFNYSFANRPDPTAFLGLPGIFLTGERFANGRGTYCFAAQHTNGNIYWRREDGRVAQSATINYYIDQVSGNDANNGTSSATPIKTLAQLLTLINALPAYRRSGLVVASKRGSYWRERFAATSLMFGTIFTTYGTATDAKPTVDCSDVIPNANFTASGTGNAWAVSLAVGTDPNASEWPNVWVNGKLLALAPSLVACGSTPGTIYYGVVSDTTPITVYVNPPGGTNPTTDGKTYEASMRVNGFDFYSAEECEMEDYIGKRNYGSYGSIVLGRYCHTRRCETNEGSAHNLFLRDFCIVEDHEAYDAYSGLSGPTLYVYYEGSPSPNAWVKLIRCRGGATRNQSMVPVAITGITVGSTTTVTAPGHTLANNTLIRIAGVSGVVGAVPINGTRFNVTASNTGAGTFQIQRITDYVVGSYSAFNTTGYTAYSSGGTVDSDAYTPIMIGFLCHGGGTFENVFMEDCEFDNCGTTYTGTNLNELVLKTCSAYNFSVAIKSGALRQRVIGGTYKNNATINGSQFTIMDGAGTSLDISGAHVKIQQTGHIQSTFANTRIRVTNCELTGFRYLLRGNQANQTWEFSNNKVILGNTSLTGLSAYWIQNSTGLTLKINYNDLGGGPAAGWNFIVGATTYATLADWQAAGYDVDSKA
jgi:hypothetical protein